MQCTHYAEECEPLDVNTLIMDHLSRLWELFKTFHSISCSRYRWTLRGKETKYSGVCYNERMNATSNSFYR
jgi:hypothetical protein